MMVLPEVLVAVLRTYLVCVVELLESLLVQVMVLLKPFMVLAVGLESYMRML